MNKKSASTAKIAVIGGGLGALACAAKLSHAGARVTIFEKNATCGGKMSELRHDGFRWDMGPSLLTMPEVITELWKSLGRDSADALEITRLPATCKYHWRDGTIIHENADFWQRPDVARYLKHAKGIYDLSAEAFLKNAPDELWRQFTLANLRNLIHLPKVASTQSLHELNRSFFKDPHLVEIFDRFATYNGSSPYQTPAVFSIIAYVQAAFGGHYIQGGMVQLANALTQLNVELGTEICLNEEVFQVRQSNGKYSLITHNKSHSDFDFVVCNQDAIQATKTLLADENSQKESKNKPPDSSTSGLVVFLGLKTKNSSPEHHNILFSRNYALEFKQIHQQQQLADDPTIYISIASRTDSEPLRRDREAWFVLVNTPAHRKNSYTRADYDFYADKITQTLLDEGYVSSRGDIQVQDTFTPLDFAERHNAWRGSLYGYASHGLMSSFQRPSMKHPTLPNFYFTGGTTHPGGGIPLVLLSGQIVARKIARVARIPLN